MGLRERKKDETRRRISDIATRMFLTRGYANVTVAEVAEAAGVSKMTVFNYFATKEDLLLDHQPGNVAMMRAAVLERRPGQSVVSALREWCHRLLAEHHPMSAISDGVATFWNEILSNQDLRNRSLQQAQELTDALADTLAESIPGRWQAEAAAQLIGATIGTVFSTAVRKQMNGVPLSQVREEQKSVIDAAFALLEHGLGPYGT
jgi:AcrR family transcriptional regulator